MAAKKAGAKGATAKAAKAAAAGTRRVPILGKTIQDIMRKDAGIDGDAQRIGQLAWMLFLKILDDREMENEATRKRYRSPIPDALRWHTWAKGPGGMAGDELLAFVDDTLFPGLKGLAGTDPLSGVVRSVFEDAASFMKSGPLLRQVVDALNEIDWSRPADRHQVGALYEQLLGDLRSTGNEGEYYTPRALVSFIVERVNPQLGETILDPACGTGGLLVSAVEHIRATHQTTDADEKTLQASIHGIEKMPLPHLLCMTNMVLHGIDAPTQILRSNALAPATSDKRKDLADVVVTTPPFGGVEENGIEKAFPALFRTQETADLFLYLIVTLLCPGGRAAVVVPDGLLSGDGAKRRIKEKLLEECNLHTIVRLPSGVFSPYTRIKTNVFFFTKGEPTREIWYYDHPYPPGYKSYTKTHPIRIEDFEPEREWWDHRQTSERAWKVSIGAVKARGYNLDAHNPSPNLGRAPSRIAWLKLSHFRGFGSLTLELPKEGPAVLIGVNGAGKSSVLSAAAMHLSSFTAFACGLSARQVEVQLGEADIKMGDEGAGVRTMLRIGADEQVWELFVSRERGAGTSDKKAAWQAEALLEGLQRAEQTSIPVLCYYPATRGLGEGALSSAGKRPAPRLPQLEAYDRAFGSNLGPFQDFVRWFREEEDIENEGRLRINPGYLNPRLETVRRAIGLFVNALGAGSFSGLRMERFTTGEGTRGVAKPAELVLDKDGVRLSVQQLSEGERNTILLVADLARRFAIANPSLEDPLQGEGIVLIDEIDLHLHPAWQRGLLPALTVLFPRCQIIATTHSPQVLSRTHKENVFILENFNVVRVAPHTYGKDSNSILGEVFGVAERPADMEEKIRHAADLIDQERATEARAALDELLSILGEHDAELVGLKTMMSFLERPVRD